MAARFATWTDEEYTLLTTAHGPLGAWSEAITRELQAPLYYVLLSLWRGLNDSVFFARLFSILCVVATTLVVTMIAHRYRPDGPTAALVAAVAVNPFVVFAAIEARLYAPVLLWSALLLVTFYDGFIREGHNQLRARIAFAVLAVLGAAIQYFVAFLLPAFAVALYVGKRYAALRAYILTILPTVVPILGLAWLAVYELRADPWPPDSLALRIKAALDPISSFLLPHSWHTSAAGQLIYVAIAAALMAIYFAGRPAFSPRLRTFAAIPAVTALIFLLGTIIFEFRIIAPRYEAVLCIPLLATAYTALGALRSSLRPLVTRTLVAAYCIATAISLFLVYRADAKTGDWARVGAYLEANVRSGDVVAVMDNASFLPFSHYFHAAVRTVPIPRPVQYDHYRTGEFVIHSEDEVRHSIGTHALGGHRLWLVVDTSCRWRNPDHGCRYLESVVSQQYRTIDRRAFYESTVRLLEPKPPFRIGRSKKR